MEFRRRTKKLSGLPIAFYVVALVFFVLLFSFNSLYYKASEQPKPVVTEIPRPKIEPKKDSVIKPEIYVPDVEVLPADTVSIAKDITPVKEDKKEISKTDKAKAEAEDKNSPKKTRKLKIQKKIKSLK
ncbi:hypothetical protein [Epilithonimonas sp. UC225_85]|uniref:hypothetical protein n=1 Tax=Epilithonimonas sp. UC225_85 TaxID=3350167 RepID=UPI0036D2AFEA